MNQIETARILIRPYRPSDADSVWQVLRRKEIYDTTYAIPRNYPRERVDWWIQFVESARKNRTSYEFGMFDKHKMCIRDRSIPVRRPAKHTQFSVFPLG